MGEQLYILKTPVNIIGKHDVEGWLRSGHFARVRSTNVRAIAYEHTLKDLTVQYIGKHGSIDRIYLYHLVPEKVAHAFYHASSQGAFTWQRIRGKYPTGRLRYFH